jgi:uncharacterized membrane protein YoaK (UPF0700 family)
MIAIWGFLLAFIAGFADTATFVGARGVFSAHVTGNFVLFAVALFKGVHEIDYLKIFLFVPFLLAVALVARLSRVARLQKHFEATMLIVASLLLFIPAYYFFGVTQLKDELWDTANLFIMLPVIAMGIQNGLYKILCPTEPMTTVMTGNAIQVVLEATGYANAKGDKTARRKKAVSIFRIVAGFALGCLTAAWMVNAHSLGALILPASILLGLGIYKFKSTKSISEAY